MALRSLFDKLKHRLPGSDFIARIPKDAAKYGSTKERSRSITDVMDLWLKAAHEKSNKRIPLLRVQPLMMAIVGCGLLGLSHRRYKD